MAELTFTSEGVKMPRIDECLMRRWIAAVAGRFGRSVGNLAYIFCNDEKIIEVNRKFLNHDYYTDIITFDYGSRRRISGDMFISLDTVASNAAILGCDPETEFYRVLIHGILHLCGVNDKGIGEREIMEKHENEALAVLREMKNSTVHDEI